jgi:hypothetical protein
MNVLVIELNKYHTEIFPIYENLLPFLFKPDVLRFHYYCLPGVQKELAEVYEHVECVISRPGYFLIQNLGLRIPVFRRKIQKLIHSLDADAVVLNSIEPHRNQKIFKGLTAERKIAVIHNPRKFALQKEKNEHYFVLSETVFEAFRERLPLDGFLLPFFKPYPTRGKVKMSSPVIIGIQGWVNFKRRDYGFLIEVCRKLKELKTEGVLINIIGANNHKDGKKLRDLIREHDLESYFRLHESLDDRSFYNEIEGCDLLMPLLGPDQKRYFSDKTTATLSHAAAYGKPMVISRENAKAWSLNEDAHYIYDDIQSCVDLLKDLKDLSGKTERFIAWRDEKIRKNREKLSRIGIQDGK